MELCWNLFDKSHFSAGVFLTRLLKNKLCLLSDLQLSEKDKPYVDIQGLTASTMEILLDFQELLPAACLLQLKGNADCWCGLHGCC